MNNLPVMPLFVFFVLVFFATLVLDSYGLPLVTYEKRENITSACNCNPEGSWTRCADENTQLCTCKPNIVGIKCDSCKPGWSGFGAEGCLIKDKKRPKRQDMWSDETNSETKPVCDCDAVGSYSLCEEVKTSLCDCKPHVVGRRCHSCEPGWSDFGPHGCTHKD